MSIEIAVDRIQRDPTQPRTRFPRSELEELAASINANGLLQPITVRLIAPDPRVCFGGDRYGPLAIFMLVAGERRWRAHQLAGLLTIRADVIEVEAQQKDILAIVENLQRADLTPLEEGRAFQRMLNQGMTQEELARRLGLKNTWRIVWRTALLALRPEYQDLLEKGHLTASQANEMARLPWPQQDAMLRMIRDGKCETAPKLKAAADMLRQAEAEGDGFFEPPPPISDRELKKLTAFERKIEQVVQLVAAGFTESEVTILRKINPARASVVAAQLAIIENHLKQLDAELRKAIARGALQESVA